LGLILTFVFVFVFVSVFVLVFVVVFVLFRMGGKEEREEKGKEKLSTLI
jgi:hypothetical protein